ncbi:hypothetical protein HH219_11215 [Pseudoalteromonas sp. NEC-BIFX-2020_015]|uniref:hypothetical protein n=1 Tax=Pseudoalteromonas sp. NEC-BIFX-2020_015 TaxID=2729544 RepID=UPI0014615E4F|nr:hypothetical protein [Pseudoalteromonas sp. NEC-BIFX-2020_015]NMR26097.1 hypothetical protein [Pseudoalteromonas sp. NEC-BIFX-2020_015]
MKKTLLLSGIIALSGCAANPYLQPAANGPSAKLRLASVPSNNNFVGVPSQTDCISTKSEAGSHIATLGLKANLVRSLSRLDMPAYDTKLGDSHQNEVYIPAQVPFSFQFNGVGIAGFAPGKTDSGGALYSWCRKIVSFEPKENGNYEALYDYIELPNGKETCGVKLFEIVADSSGDYKKVEMEDYQVVENYCK